MTDTVAAEIERTLAATRIPGSRNKITAADLRQWAVEYLGDHDEELVRFPELAGQPHWNLWMMDADPEDALFAVLVLGPIGVRFVCGTGNSFDIRGWDTADPANPSGLEAELRRHFRVPEPGMSISRADAEAWFGRGW
jgi:hypothetical protein